MRCRHCDAQVQLCRCGGSACPGWCHHGMGGWAGHWCEGGQGTKADVSRECNCTCQIAGAHDPDCAVYGPPQEPEWADTPADSGQIAAPLTGR